MLHIHISNRLEILVDQLAEVVRDPLPDPMMAETIVVQSKGMEHWVSMQLAQKLGVWANGQFPFPNEIMRRLLRDAGVRPEAEAVHLDASVIAWSLMDLLPAQLHSPAFTELRHYLREDQQQVKLFHLARRIADTLDQYVIFRPKMILDWEKGNEADNWQAILWRMLRERHGEVSHRAALQADFLQSLAHLANNPYALKRLSIFGIPALPPFYLDVFAHAGQVIDVHIFLTNPCQEHWGYILSDPEIARATRRAGDDTITAESLYLEKGNSLLASMGKQARDFIDLINEYQPVTHEQFSDAGEDCLLHCLQADILYLRDRGECPLNSTEPTVKPLNIDADDHSLQIHACYSPLREVEVLYDQLLALFEAHDGLYPHEILVMTPKIEIYAPLVQTVFGTVTDEKRRLPFSIADRTLSAQSALIDTFMKILHLPHGRFTFSEVLVILEVEAVQRRFDLLDTHLPLIRHWLHSTAVRWGLNEKQRSVWDMPPIADNTWQAGLDRLLLGYSLPEQGTQLFDGILPFDDMEGSETQVLGNFLAFVHQLAETLNQLSQSHSITDWGVLLTRMLDSFFSTDENSEFEARQVRKVIATLVSSAEQADFHAPINVDIIRNYLRYYLDDNDGSPVHLNYLTGGITFCAMLPMRSIPFRVICLLGMNDSDYPRSHRPLSFDLIAQNPKKGDRSLRYNDRYLFLESLLSARDVLYISYIGHNVRDNNVRPPSVLVSELLDYVGRGFNFSDSQDSREAIVIHHPLQPFSRRYFLKDEKALFSYSEEYCGASDVLQQSPSLSPGLFLKQSLPTVDEEWKIIDFNRLQQFFRHPARFLLTHRLQLTLPDVEQVPEDSEPFELGKGPAMNLGDHLVLPVLAGTPLPELFDYVRAQGVLPHGAFGTQSYADLQQALQPFIDRVQAAQAKCELLPPCSKIVHTAENLQLHGRLNTVREHYLLSYRYADLSPRDHLRVWLQHLLLNSMAEKDRLIPRETRLIGKDVTWLYRPVENSEDLLRDFLVLYWQGLHLPLRLFPKSSYGYAEAFRKEKDKDKAADKAFGKALNLWKSDGQQQIRTDADDAYLNLCFGHLNAPEVLDQSFCDLALQVFGPLLAHREKVS